MGLLDSKLKQRMVGAVVLIALAVIFLPMLFSRDDHVRPVTVEAPPIPDTPAMPTIEAEPYEVPEPSVPEPDQLPPQDLPAQPNEPVAPVVTPTPQAPAAPAVAEPKPQPKAESKPSAAQQPSRLNQDNLPVSWTVQLASLSNKANAERLQQTLRSQGYNAYIRTSGGLNRVFVGPVLDRGEAVRLRDQLERKHQLKGLVTNFQPERN